MNQPLGKFHRPRLGAGLREWAGRQVLPRRMPGDFQVVAQATFVKGFAVSTPRNCKACATPRRNSSSVGREAATSLVSIQPAELVPLTLIVSLLMSWYATKLKQAMAQKKAVEAILVEQGTVEYDYQFDEAGEEIKGAQGHGPAWLRVAGARSIRHGCSCPVDSAKGMEAVNGLLRLRSLSIDAMDDRGSPEVSSGYGRTGRT